MNPAQPHEQNGHSDSAELDLLALRYVTGEMSTDESAAFERRLAEEQEARESVSRVVLIGTAIVGAPEPVAAEPAAAEFASSPGWRPSRWWLAAAAVVVLGIGAGLYVRSTANPASPVQPTAGEAVDEDEASSLIARYVDDLPDAAFAEAGLEASIDPLDPFDEVEEVEGSEVTLDIGAEAPAWMVQALAK